MPFDPLNFCTDKFYYLKTCILTNAICKRDHQHYHRVQVFKVASSVTEAEESPATRYRLKNLKYCSSSDINPGNNSDEISSDVEDHLSDFANSEEESLAVLRSEEVAEAEEDLILEPVLKSKKKRVSTV